MTLHQITYANATFTRTRPNDDRSARWECDTCHRLGYGDDFVPGVWATTCARGHSDCPWCHKPQPVKHDGSPRVHTHCKERPEDLDEKWGRVKVDLRETRDALAGGAR